VLIVDDEPSNRSGLAKLLKQEEYDVDVAADGLGALAIAATSTPDILVTDLRMPNMDGVALFTRLREVHRDLPVVILSAAGDAETQLAATRVQAVAYLPKPVDFDALLVLIDRALAGSVQRK
jgi:two-component system response regulator HydG